MISVLLLCVVGSDTWFGIVCDERVITGLILCVVGAMITSLVLCVVGSDFWFGIVCGRAVVTG